MKYAFAPFAFGLGTNALVARQSQQCVQLQASGGASGILGQLGDGQNRIGDGNPTGCYCLGHGSFTDSNDRGCILTPPTTQFQCDTGATPTSGFDIGPDGIVTYNGNPVFYACPVNEKGVYNIYSQPIEGEPGCVKITLSSAGSCGSGAPKSSPLPQSPPKPSPPGQSPPKKPPPKQSPPPQQSPNPSQPSYPTKQLPEHSTPPTKQRYSSYPTQEPSQSPPYPSKPTLLPEQSSKPGYPTQKPSPSSPQPSKPIPPHEQSSKPGYATQKPSPSLPQPSKPAPLPEQSSKPGYLTQKPRSPYPGRPAGSPSKGCPEDLNGNYQYPHLIVPVDSHKPDQKFGSSYNCQIRSTVCSIFNFDIPQSYSGNTCTLVFLFPKQSQLETSTYKISGHGEIDVTMLKNPASENTSYNNQPGKASSLGSFSVSPGNSYTISSGSCAASQTVSYELCGTGDLSLNYFQDYNPSPIGLYIRKC
ncbi:hypothetical protein CC78DRAFT_473734 [Lojkania enalia]|uniref:Ubiquitin 3 binding protein But2 C-terminal domain-containing protein n=1 Tax=Lojkania enalia TaxID=147567 RepID=A0A9P4N042_9PLEO|nr:hypothetical protein CC78DRAFT_473734 [Didymosphaeria enalia]